MEKKNKQLGTMCKEFRKAHNVSVAAFAIQCGCSRESIYKFEEGRSDSSHILLQYFRFIGGKELEKIKALI